MNMILHSRSQFILFEYWNPLLSHLKICIMTSFLTTRISRLMIMCKFDSIWYFKLVFNPLILIFDRGKIGSIERQYNHRCSKFVTKITSSWIKTGHLIICHTLWKPMKENRLCLIISKSMVVVWVHPKIVVSSCHYHWNQSHIVPFNSIMRNICEQKVPYVIACVHIIVITQVTPHHDQVRIKVISNVFVLLLPFFRSSQVSSI